MNETRIICTYMFGQMCQKGDHIMFGHGFDFIDSRDIKLHVFGTPNGGGVFFGNDSYCGLCVTGMGLDLVPDTKFAFG